MFDFLRDTWLWMTGQGGGVPRGSGKGRTYHFPLPYKLSAMEIMYGVKMLKKARVWNRIPSNFRVRMEKSANKWHSLRVTENDLNQLDDATWKLIANKLNLKWSV